ncbi:hypothetical protein FHX81_0420 [Saccharothrix saharensis]|uniref:Uncharacterized protein n=2 Tax=Saccharothrix saharensis TaxID=571190 RepID=A0A543J5Q6_9PSEU|nr:hypothetical protein FHX81_0420 [Saccharothrix saharensis]
MVRRVCRVGLLVVVAGAAGFAAGVLVTFPYYATLALSGHAVPDGVPLVVILGGVLGVVSLGRRVRALVGRGQGSGPDPSAVRRALSLRTRISLDRRVHLYTHLRWAVGVSAPAALLLVLAASTAGRESMPPAASSDGSAWTTVFLGSALLVLIVFNRLATAVAVVLSPAHAAVALRRCLDQDDRPTARTGWAHDPLGRQRRNLEQAARALTLVGRRLDRAWPGHPLASSVLGGARYLRRFLNGSDSLTSAYPDQLVDVLNGLMIVLAEPGDSQKVAALGVLVGAFDAEGQPLGELRRESPGRWTVALTRTGDLLDRYSRIATAVWAIFSLVVVTVLILTDNLDLTKFQLQK